MKKVMVFGTFDIFHKGHKSFLQQAKKYGKLTIILARDKTVLKIKGHLPKNKEKERLGVIKKTKLAKKVLPGYLRDKYKIIAKHKPDIVCLGYDQTHFTDKLKEKLNQFGLRKTKIIRLNPYCPEKYKSSKL
ncbi:MAG: adenylyltransferase/cytidyltransferase family protein [bacterium]